MTVNQQYNIKYLIKGYPDYGVTEGNKYTRKVFNLKTNKELKKSVIGTTIGVSLKGKFININKLRIVAIPKINCPF